MKQFVYFLQACLMAVFFGLFAILPLDIASALGGCVGKLIGLRLGASKKALKNIEAAFPGLKDDEKKKILVEMWNNLGRTFAEYPHLEKIARLRARVDGLEILNECFAKDAPMILIAAHLANWEVNGASLYVNYGKPLHLTYRAMNNPFADKILMRARTLGGKLPAYPKSRESGRQILAALKGNKCLGILIDQKYNEGVAVPFFNVPAMTNPVFVQLGQKFKCPVVPVQAIRTKGANFILKVHKPLELFDADGKPLPLETVLREAHVLLERWIREHPGQWLWLHRRWDSKALKIEEILPAKAS